MYSTRAKLSSSVVGSLAARLRRRAPSASLAPPSISPAEIDHGAPSGAAHRGLKARRWHRASPPRCSVRAIVWWRSSPTHGHRVDHAPDQEQAPAARRLLARELGVQVGRRGARDRPGAALVGDPDRSARGLGGRDEMHGQPRRRSRCRAPSRSSSPRRRRSSAARAALRRERERRDGGSATPAIASRSLPGSLARLNSAETCTWSAALRRSETSVMSSSCSPSPPVNSPSDVEQRGRSVARRRPARRRGRSGAACRTSRGRASCASTRPSL